MAVTDLKNEWFWPGQPHQLYDALTCPKELVAFTAAEGADSHCEPKAFGLREQRIFDRLDETLKTRSTCRQCSLVLRLSLIAAVDELPFPIFGRDRIECLAKSFDQRLAGALPPSRVSP
jgi:hypothetical protein